MRNVVNGNCRGDSNPWDGEEPQERPPLRQRGAASLVAGLHHWLDLLLHELLVHLTDLQADHCLEETSAVLGPREGGVLQHLLGDLAVELGRGVTEVALNIDELLKLVKLPVHLQHRHLQEY